MRRPDALAALRVTPDTTVTLTLHNGETVTGQVVGTSANDVGILTTTGRRAKRFVLFTEIRRIDIGDTPAPRPTTGFRVHE